MVDLNKSIDALEYIVKEHNVGNSIPEKDDLNVLRATNGLDEESVLEDYEDDNNMYAAYEEELKVEQPIYRLGLTKEDHAKILLLSSLIAKRYNRHIGKNLPSEKLNKAFSRSKFLNNSLFYKMGFVIFGLIVWQFKLTAVSLILIVMLISVYLFSLYALIKTEKYIFKYISALQKTMSEDLLDKKVNVLELIYEIVRTKDLELNKLMKIKLKEIYKRYIKEYKKNNKEIKVKNYLSYKDLLDLYEKDLYKKSVNGEEFIFRIIIEEIYQYRSIIEKQKSKI